MGFLSPIDFDHRRTLDDDRLLQRIIDVIPRRTIHRALRLASAGRHHPLLVQVQFRTSATRGRPSTAGLRQAINRLAGALGRVKSLTFSAVTVGRLRGISGTATYARKPYRLVVVALPDRSGRHLFMLTAVVHSRATAPDLRQYQAIIASLQPTR